MPLAEFGPSVGRDRGGRHTPNPVEAPSVSAKRYRPGEPPQADLVKQMAGLIKLGCQTIDLDYEAIIPRNAEAIAVARVGASIVGCCAYKRPDADYRDHVFEKAESGEDADDYRFERGWLVVHPEYRQRGIATQLMAALDAEMSSEPSYVTVRATNEIARHIATADGFVPSGEPYSGLTGNLIVLLVRN